MKKYIYIKPFILIMLLLTACNDDILEKSNPAQLSTDTFFQTADQLQSSVNAIYSALQANQLYNREYFFLHDMLSDENSANSQLEAPRRAVLEYSLAPTNLLIVSVFTGCYRVIHRANLVISKAGEVPEIEISEDMRNRLIAEARFLRAWAYFELVSLWGPVPMLTEPATSPEGSERTPVNTIYDEVIIPDLDFAEENLLLKSEYDAADLGRATKGSAQALKGRIYLFRAAQDPAFYADAREELDKVIQSVEYSLVDSYMDNFTHLNENNAESIFEVQFSESFGSGNPWSPDGNGIAEITFRGQEYTPVTGWNNVDPAEGLRNAYEAGDPRFDYNFFVNGDTYNNGTETMEGLEEPGWQKYSNAYQRNSENQISGINFRVIRYADVLLMMAEVENELNGPDAAVGYVNQVRARPSVDMPPITPTPATKEEMFDLIVNERRVELAGEQIRNRDIRRWRRAGKLDSEPIANYRDIHDLLPLPTNEIDNNSALGPEDQNPGY